MDRLVSVVFPPSPERVYRPSATPTFEEDEEGFSEDEGRPHRRRRRVVAQDSLSSEARRFQIGMRWLRYVGGLTKKKVVWRRRRRACKNECEARRAACRAVRRLCQATIVELVAQYDREEYVDKASRLVCLAAKEGSLLDGDALDDAAACAAVLLLFADEDSARILLRALIASGGLFQGHRILSASRAVAVAVSSAYPLLANLSTAVETLSPGLVGAALVDVVPLPALVVVWDDFFLAVGRHRHRIFPLMEKGVRSSSCDVERRPTTVEKSDSPDEPRDARPRAVSTTNLGETQPAAVFVRSAVALLGSCREIVFSSPENSDEVAAAVFGGICACADADRLKAELDALEDVIDRAAARAILDDHYLGSLSVAEWPRRRRRDDDDDRLEASAKAASASRAAALDLRERKITKARREDLASDNPLVDRAFELASAAESGDGLEVSATTLLAALELAADDDPPRLRLDKCLELISCGKGTLCPVACSRAVGLVAGAAHGDLSVIESKARALKLVDPEGIPVRALRDALLSEAAVVRFLYATPDRLQRQIVARDARLGNTCCFLCEGDSRMSIRISSLEGDEAAQEFPSPSWMLAPRPPATDPRARELAAGPAACFFCSGRDDTSSSCVIN